MIALGALIGLGAVVLLGVNLYVQSQGAQAKIQQELSRSLGVPLKIRSMSVTPWGGLELSGITIPQTVPVGPKNLLEARTFRLPSRTEREDMTRLLRETFRLSRVELNEVRPSFDLVLNARRALIREKLECALIRQVRV